MKRTIILISILAIFLLCLFISLLLFLPKTCDFSVEEWDTNISQRVNMMNSLTEQYALEGMYYDDVIKLPGTNGVVLLDENRITYSIGEDFYLSIVFVDEKVLYYDRYWDI